MNYNYLLFVPSLVTKASSIEYKVNIERKCDEKYPIYNGIQTNEAVTKFTIDYLKNNGESLNKIIMLCTDEVREERLEEINNKTTLEYYEDSINQYLLRETNFTEEAVTDIFEVVRYIPKNNENENQIMKALEEIIVPEENTTIKKRIFIDFTGGIRSAALTLVFVGRILDKLGINVAKIFYSNLKREKEGVQGIIEECTNTYRIFSTLEKEIKIKYDIVDTNDGDEDQNEEQAQIEENRKNLITAKRMNQSSEIMQKNKEIDAGLKQIDRQELSYMQKKLLREMEKKNLEFAKEIQDPLFSIKNHLENARYEKALSEFREKISQILLDFKIIKVNERYLSNDKINGDIVVNEIAATYAYYTGDNSKGTFNQFIKQYIKMLNNNKDKSPIEIKEKYFGEKYFDIGNYLDKVPKWGFKHNGYSRAKCDDIILPYIEKKYKEHKDFRKSIQMYFGLDNLYMGYGFPFACTYAGRYYFDGYDRLYRDIFDKGVVCLQEYYDGKENKKVMRAMNLFPEEQFTYESFIEALDTKRHNRMLYMLFPYQLKNNNIRVGNVDYKQWTEFMFEFAKSYSFIKNIRNKVTHTTNTDKNEGNQAIEELKKIIAMIEKVKENQ